MSPSAISEKSLILSHRPLARSDMFLIFLYLYLHIFKTRTKIWHAKLTSATFTNYHRLAICMEGPWVKLSVNQQENVSLGIQ